MSLDITWCTGLRCGRTQECQRFEGRLKRIVEKDGLDWKTLKISMAQFADYDGKCDKFWPLNQGEITI